MLPTCLRREVGPTFSTALGVILCGILAIALLLPSPATYAAEPESGSGGAASAMNLPAERELPEFQRTSAPWNTAELEGRRFLHHTHVDAAHADWNAEEGTFDVKVIDGSTPTAADSVVVRLGPDADTEGREISRIKVPAGKRFRFLGAAGAVVWNAPEKWYHNWAPVWSGVGTGHDFPSTIDTDTVTLELVRVSGPGWISVWNGGVEDATEFFSTRNPGHTRLKSPAGGHGHFNWSFEKPGRYQFVWRAMGKSKSGEAIVGPERTVEWLVGTDEDLGLPAGSWKQARAITVPVEDQGGSGEASGGSDGGDGSSGDSGSGDSGSGDSGSGGPEPLGEEASAPSDGYTCLAPAHYDLSLDNSAEWKGKKGDMAITLTGLVSGKEVSYGDWEAVIPVPDSAASTLTLADHNRALAPLGEGSRIWTLPQQQKPTMPWVGFSSDRADFSAMSEDGLRLYAESFTGPGRMLSYTSDAFTGLAVHHDSRDSLSKVSFPQPTHLHLAQAFNRPGLYEVYWKYQANYTDPAWLNGITATSFAVYYAVGNERIEQLCPGWLAAHDQPSTGNDEGAPSTGDGGEQPSTPGEGSGHEGGSSTADGGESGSGDDSASGESGSAGSSGSHSGSGQPGTGDSGSGSGSGSGGAGSGDADSGREGSADTGDADTGSGTGHTGSDDAGTVKPQDPAPVITPPREELRTAAMICRATTVERAATSAEESQLRRGLLPAEPGAGRRYNSASTTLTFVVGPQASGNAVSGHYDLGPVVSDGTIAARVKSDAAGRWLPGSSLRFAIGDAGKRTVPAAMNQIAPAGSQVWMIGATQEAHVPWLGVNSQHGGLSATTGPVEFALESVSGPGKLIVFESGTFGGVGRVLLSSTGSHFTLPARTHAHHNWVFTAPGTYTVTLRMSVTPTGAALAALTDAPAGAARVVATAKVDGAGRTIVRETVGRTDSGQACDIALPGSGLPGLAGGITTAVAGNGGSPLLLDAATSTTEDELAAGEPEGQGGVRRLQAEKKTGASGTAEAAATATGDEAHGTDWWLVAGSVLTAMLLQAGATFLILTHRARRGARR